ncbi:MAG: hypothetical protein NXI01_00625 [Gammaproteobacteria bacterium]|nr:hypothetical protein [Gammaproteobacteria bacterium]
MAIMDTDKALNFAESELGSQVLSAMSPLTGTPVSPEQIKMGASMAKTAKPIAEEAQKQMGNSPGPKM